MSIIKDTFFGGAEKKAAKSQQQGIERGIEATQAATREARQAAIPLFGQARQDLQQGFQGALDVFGQSLPAQVQAFQSGNVGAQEQLLAGLPLFQNAILGGQLDFSQLQPTQVQTPDLGFFQQQLPSTIQAQQESALNSGLGPFTPNNPAFDGLMGPFQVAAPSFINPNQGTLNPQGNLNTDFRAFGSDFIPRGPGDTPQQQLPRNLFSGADTNAFRRGPFGQNIGGF